MILLLLFVKKSYFYLSLLSFTFNGKLLLFVYRVLKSWLWYALLYYTFILCTQRLSWPFLVFILQQILKLATFLLFLQTQVIFQEEKLKKLQSFLIISIPHCYSIRLNLKKMGLLQFCLPVFLGINKNPKQKEFFNLREGLLG